jgi:disulfide bond formation protein DsbB
MGSPTQDSNMRAPGTPIDASPDLAGPALANPILLAALTVALLGTATILGAYYFEYGLGLRPCPLCLEQRIPYYIAIPLALLVAVAAVMRAPRIVLVAGLGLIALALLVNAGLGVYHSGIEWGFWPGPQDCSGPVQRFDAPGGILKQIETINVVRCDEAPWRFLGLSLAGYNVLISLALAAAAMWGIAASRSRLNSA